MGKNLLADKEFVLSTMGPRPGVTGFFAKQVRIGMRLTFGNHSGATIIEVIAVLVIVAIMSAVAASRFTTTDTYTLFSEAAILKTHLRYAQFRAMSDDAAWKVELTPTTYTLFQRGAGGNWVTSNLPDTPDQSTHTFQGGVTNTDGDMTVVFDQWGSPGATDIQVNLSAGSELTAIDITKNTGFIQ